jgi:hypothetical protein
MPADESGPRVRDLRPLIINRGFRRKLEQISCSTCSPQHICNGTVRDHQAVFEGGKCIERIRKLFDAVATATCPFRCCEWFTVSNDQGSASDTWIHLAIPSLLDRDSFSAIPYVLFHECVCHGFQNLGPGFKPRRAPSPADSFSEGWMDVVCLEILEDIVAGTSCEMLN